MSKPGIIIMAYKGMGKTTLVKKNPRYVEIEKEILNYKHDWQFEYIDAALNAINDGNHDVCFIEPTKEGIEYLISLNKPFVIFYPIIKKSMILERLAKKVLNNNGNRYDGVDLADVVLDYTNDITELRTYSNAIATEDGFINEELVDKLVCMSEEERNQILQIMQYMKQSNNTKPNA